MVECQHYAENMKMLVEVCESSKSAHIRINETNARLQKLKDNYELLHNMNANIKIITQEQINQNDKIKGIGEDLKELKEKPMREWSKIKTAIVTAILTTIAVATLTNFDAFLQIFN